MSFVIQEAETAARARPRHGKKPARAKKRRQRRKFLPHHQLPVAGPVAIAPRADPPTVRFLTRQEVLDLVGGADYLTLHNWMKVGTFPLPRVLSGESNAHNAVIRWLESEVVAWAHSRPKRGPGWRAALPK